MSAEIYDILSSGTAFTNPLNSLSSGATGEVTSGQSSIASIKGVTDTNIKNALTGAGLDSNKLEVFNGTITTAQTGIGTLTAYGDQTVGEMQSRINTSVSYMNGLKSIGRAPSNCDLVNKTFAVVQQKGQEWLGEVQSVLNTVNTKLKDLEALIAAGAAAVISEIQTLARQAAALIDEAVAKVAAVVKNITDGIAEELAHIEDMIKNCLNFSVINVLNDWMEDSCAGQIVKSVGSSAFNKAIS